MPLGLFLAAAACSLAAFEGACAEPDSEVTTENVSDELGESQLSRWYADHGYEVVEPDTSPLDMSFFTEWHPGERDPVDPTDRGKEIKLEHEMWQSIHDPNTSSINGWLHLAATTLATEADGDARFARANVLQPFGCLRSFADNYFSQVAPCIFEGKQGWHNEREGKVPNFLPPFASAAEGKRRLSTNVNSWVMRYSMNSFEHMLKGQLREAAQSLEYQLRIGVEGRASAAFSYALFRPQLKLRIHTQDGRYLTPIERSLDLLANCDDPAVDYHDKTCRHTSPLAPHKYSGMLFALSEIQGKAAVTLSRPEWTSEKQASEKLKLATLRERTLERLVQTETQTGMEENLDPEVSSFMKSRHIAVKPWAFADQRLGAAASLPQRAIRWNKKSPIIGLDYVGLIQLPMMEYAKGSACVGCHQQANETFDAGYQPHY